MRMEYLYSNDLFNYTDLSLCIMYYVYLIVTALTSDDDHYGSIYFIKTI